MKKVKNIRFQRLKQWPNVVKLRIVLVILSHAKDLRHGNNHRSLVPTNDKTQGRLLS